MEDVIKFYNAQRKANLTTCAAVRATTVKFVDVPRTELQKVLVEKCQVNPSTARTQIQLGRVQANTPVVEAKPAAKPAKSKQPAKQPAKKAAKPVVETEPVVEQPAAVVHPLVTAAPKAKRAAAK
jgi:hypothetical protein